MTRSEREEPRGGRGREDGGMMGEEKGRKDMEDGGRGRRRREDGRGA